VLRNQDAILINNVLTEVKNNHYGLLYPNENQLLPSRLIWSLQTQCYPVFLDCLTNENLIALNDAENLLKGLQPRSADKFLFEALEYANYGEGRNDRFWQSIVNLGIRLSEQQMKVYSTSFPFHFKKYHHYIAENNSLKTTSVEEPKIPKKLYYEGLNYFPKNPEAPLLPSSYPFVKNTARR
jgi:hypothetical protein